MNPAALLPLSYRKKNGDRVRLFIGGDVMTGRAIDQLFPAHNPDDFGKPGCLPARQYLAWSAAVNGFEATPLRHDYIWGSKLGILDQAQTDFRLANLETAVTTCDNWEKKGFNFRMHPANTPCLSAAGLNCCVLANNHVLDFGPDGLIQTIESLTAAGIGFAGAGSNAEEAQHPFIYSLPSGQRLLVFSWAARDSGVFPHWQAGEMRPGVNLLPDYSEETARRMVNQVSSYRRQGDITIASIHWGRNWVREIPANHRKLARHLIKYAGVDLVHGHSSHHPLGMETYRGKLIMYGCGDLINDYEGHPNYRPLKNYLGALYFVDLDAGTGNIKGLIWHAIQRRRFRLETPSQEDIAWLSHQIRLFKTSL